MRETKIKYLFRILNLEQSELDNLVALAGNKLEVPRGERFDSPEQKLLVVSLDEATR